MDKENSIVTKREIPYPYSINSDEMVERYERCYTAAINDVMTNRSIEGSLNLPSTWLGPDIKCLTKNMVRDVVAGFAFTIQWFKNPSPDERVLVGEKMLSSYFKNAILVVDTGNDPVSGYLGELNTNAMMKNNVRASVIDGGAKDTGFVKSMDFPVFCKFSSPLDAYTQNRLRGWHLPIIINGVTIEPMDVIVGDSDGVMVIPKSVAEEVLIKVEARKHFEDKIRDLIKSGVSPEEAAKRMGTSEL
jgi:4-hydroxy-4-methyl-2-oxoglutarate aldolase